MNTHYKKDRDYAQELSEIRSMMERSSKFVSLSGWSGVLAGFFALTGTYFVFRNLNFYPESFYYQALTPGVFYPHLGELILTAVLVLVLSLGSAVVLSYLKAKKSGKRAWNATSGRMLIDLFVPLLTGGIAILILADAGLLGLMAPLSLIFYGIALYSAGRYTFTDLRFLGIIQMVLGVLSLYFVSYSILLWATGFGVAHIVYGIVIYLRYER